MRFNSITYSIIPLFDGPKIEATILWKITGFFTVLAIIYFVGIFVFKYKIALKRKRVALKKKELAPIISKFLLFDADSDKIETSEYVISKIAVRELLKDDFNRAVLSEVLQDLQRDVSGSLEIKLIQLYQELDFHIDAFKKLNSWKWHEVSKSILALTQMKVVDSYSFINRFINDKRSVIRKQAEIATVSLRDDGISFFLDNTTHTISEWQQLKLMEVLRNKESYNPPNFGAWLTSSNNDVVLFSLRLIGQYNQSNNNASLIELVKHKKSNIQEEAIQCISKFEITEALDTLKAVFKRSKNNIKICILEAISIIGSKKELSYLYALQDKNHAFIVQSKILSVINVIAPNSETPNRGIVALNDITVVIEEPETITEKDNTSFIEPNIINPTVEEVVEEKQIINTDLDIDLVSEVIETTILVDDLTENKEENIEPQLINQSEDISTSIEVESIDIAIEEAIVEEQVIDTTLDIDVIHDVVEATDHVNNLEQNKEENIEPQLIDKSEDISSPIEVESIDTAIEEVIVEEQVIDITLDIDVIHDVVEATDHVNNLEQNKEENIEPALLEFNLQNSEHTLVDVLNTNINVEELSLISQSDFFGGCFFEQDTYNKLLLLDTIEDIGGPDEIPLLEKILRTEENDIITDSARKALDVIVEKHFQDTSVNEKINKERAKNASVFEQLFEVSDTETKLFLLDEIAQIGSKKELLILSKIIEQATNETIVAKSKTVIELLQKRIEVNFEEISIEEDSNTESEPEENLDLEYPFLFNSPNTMEFEQTVHFGSSKKRKSPNSFSDMDTTIPLEFCFLLDELEIGLSRHNNNIFDINFELTNTQKQFKIETNPAKNQDT